jgi:hypothetical protein
MFSNGPTIIERSFYYLCPTLPLIRIGVLRPVLSSAQIGHLNYKIKKRRDIINSFIPVEV